MDIRDISIEDYNYTLPEEYIAKYPLEDRSSSRLLVYRSGQIAEHRFSELPDLIPESTTLVRNNSRVIRARLLMQRATGARIEIFCLEPHEPQSYELSLGSTHSCTWHCMLGNARRWKEDETLSISLKSNTHGVVKLSANRLGGDLVRFEWDNEDYHFSDILESIGVLPIPPYLNRSTEERDLSTYQTVYAQAEGSVAAPTAGLHFTPQVFEDLVKRKIEIIDVTLHVGAGTFKPVKAERIGEHEMHRELITFERKAIERLRSALSSIIAVGTTSVRSLESLYQLGRLISLHPNYPIEELSVDQWSAYSKDERTQPSPAQSLDAVLSYMQRHKLDTISFPTTILIAPGYRFQLVKGLITNFHQPHSTLLLLIAALLGKDWRRVYNHALEQGFRFLSYGDSSLLLP